MAEEKIPLPSPRTMEKLPDERVAVPISVEGMSNRELLAHILENGALLAKKEFELAKTELRADLKKEVAMAKGLTAAGICALCTLNLLLVAIAMALGGVMAEWGAALIIAAAVLLLGTAVGLIGWGKRVKEPLEATRRSLKEDVTWAKERLA
jgi:membrane protein